MILITNLSDLNYKFRFLLVVENLLSKDSVYNDLKKNCKHLGKFYNIYFNGTELYV